MSKPQAASIATTDGDGVTITLKPQAKKAWGSALAFLAISALGMVFALAVRPVPAQSRLRSS